MKLSDYLKGKNREAFAKRLKITKTYLDNIASGNNAQCGLRTAMRIVEVTNGEVTLSDLLPKKDVKLVTQVRQ